MTASAVRPRLRPSVNPTAIPIKALRDERFEADKGEGIAVESDTRLLGKIKVGSEADGGRVGVGRKDEMVVSALIVTSIESISKSAPGALSERYVMARRDISVGCKFRMMKPPNEELKGFQLISCGVERVRFTTALDASVVESRISKARKLKNTWGMRPPVFCADPFVDAIKSFLSFIPPRIRHPPKQLLGLFKAMVSLQTKGVYVRWSDVMGMDMLSKG